MGDEKYCYSCYDQMMFQFYGQTRGYDPNAQSRLYIQRYVLGDYTQITCELCDRTVSYVQQPDLKWKEVEERSATDGNSEEDRDTNTSMEKKV